MTNEKLVSEIRSSLEQISRQYETFTWQNRVPEEDELEMLKNKLLRLCDKITSLQQPGETPVALQNEASTAPAPLTEQMVVAEQTIKTQPAVTETIPVMETIEVIVKQEPEIKAEEILQAVTQPVFAEIIEQTIVTTPPPAVVAEVQHSRTDAFKESHSTIAEQYKEEESIHDKIGVGHIGFAVADKLKLSPIPDLVKAIGLNEKFLFISNLFKNESTAFHQVVDRLNNASNYAEAYMLFDSEVALKNSVDKTSEAYLHFLDLLQRRFVK